MWPTVTWGHKRSCRSSCRATSIRNLNLSDWQLMRLMSRVVCDSCACVCNAIVACNDPLTKVVRSIGQATPSFCNCGDPCSYSFQNLDFRSSEHALLFSLLVSPSSHCFVSHFAGSGHHRRQHHRSAAATATAAAAATRNRAAPIAPLFTLYGQLPGDFTSFPPENWKQYLNAT